MVKEIKSGKRLLTKEELEKITGGATVVYQGSTCTTPYVGTNSPLIPGSNNVYDTNYQTDCSITSDYGTDTTGTQGDQGVYIR